MSLIAIGLNVLLIGLLLTALAYGRRLEARLNAVREGQAAFARAVAELDGASMRARQGLDELRAAAEESTDLLGGRVTRAREAAERLERLIARAEAVPAPREPQGGLAALMAQLDRAGSAPQPKLFERGPRAPSAGFEARPARAGRPNVDEDLFADGALS